MGENLNKIITKTATQWKTRAKQDRNNRRNITRAQAFALELMDYMDLHNIKQTDLANKMGVSAQQVNKILRAKANLTFETLDKIADALEVNIPAPKIREIKSSHSSIVHYSMQIVHKRKHKVIEENITSKIINKQNAVLNTSMENLDLYTYTANQI
ncbi:helix-turn-helix transcriptional regulator [Flavobacteriaceae bacterium GSB9]|nr:helix-turn-helix transcriptional regulator [Flavobacteriaceae bacterium GSB9]